MKWAGGNMFVGSDFDRHAIIYDSATEGVSVGFAPTPSLLPALGACTGMDIVAILKKCKQRLTSLKVLLDGERPERGNPRPYKKINVRYLIVGKQLDERQVVKAIDESMQKFCHVGATLSGPAKITHSFQIEEG